MFPLAHPYHIVDPFDRGHNPGKQVKYGRVKELNKNYSTLYKEYVAFFKEVSEDAKSGKVL